MNIKQLQDKFDRLGYAMIIEAEKLIKMKKPPVKRLLKLQAQSKKWRELKKELDAQA